MTTVAMLPLQAICTTVLHCMTCFGLVRLFSVWPRLLVSLALHLGEFLLLYIW